MKLLTDTDYIHALIAEGEHQQQDFKFEISDARKIAKTLSAFANTDGGRLLIGVKDNGMHPKMIKILCIFSSRSCPLARNIIKQNQTVR